MDPMEEAASDYEPQQDSMQPPKVHVCSMCDAQFNRKSHLTRHMRSHTNDRPHRCETCFAHFTRSDLLRRHEKVCDEGGIRSKRKACQACADSKAKCSQTQPCSRCAARGKVCEYYNPNTDYSRKGLGHSTHRHASESSSGSSPMSSPTGATFMTSFDYNYSSPSPINLQPQVNGYYSQSSPSYPNPAQSFSHPPYPEDAWPGGMATADSGWGQPTSMTAPRYPSPATGGMPYPGSDHAGQYPRPPHQYPRAPVTPGPAAVASGPPQYSSHSAPYPNFQQYPGQDSPGWY